MCKPVVANTICGLPKSKLQRATASEIAGLFCDLSDDEMAEFFEAVATEARDVWDGNPDLQWMMTGEHLVTCKDACGLGAEMIEKLYHWIQRARQHGATH
jgi:hypothetical protein